MSCLKYLKDHINHFQVHVFKLVTNSWTFELRLWGWLNMVLVKWCYLLVNWHLTNTLNMWLDYIKLEFRIFLFSQTDPKFHFIKKFGGLYLKPILKWKALMQFHASRKISFLKPNFNLHALKTLPKSPYQVIFTFSLQRHQTVTRPSPARHQQRATSSCVKPFHLDFFTNCYDTKNRNDLEFNHIRLFIVKMNIIQNQVYKKFKFSRIQAI